MSTLYHQSFLMQALILAQSRQGRTAPNPAVGALVVQNGRVVAKGCHQGPGQPHAEVLALRDVSVEPDMVLYVTLEPCCHFGRTPPCTQLIIERGITHVVYAFKDPNPKVAGQGHAVLVDNDVRCEHVPVAEIDVFYRYYAYWQRNAVPWVTVKIALTDNGDTAYANGSPLSISGAAAQQYTHQQRLHSCAILTTAQTVVADDPQLNVRLGTKQVGKPLVVLDAKDRVPKSARIYSTAASVTQVFSQNSKELTSKKSTWQLPLDDQGYFCLPDVIRRIGQAGYHRLWVEAGGTLCRGLLEQGCVNELLVYVASGILDSPGLKVPPPCFPQGRPVASLQSFSLGSDQVFCWTFD